MILFRYLNSSNSTESPQISVANPGIFFLDLFHEVSGNVQASIGSVERLGLKTHCGIVAVRSFDKLLVVLISNISTDLPPELVSLS
jgi:hypothetical protein